METVSGLEICLVSRNPYTETVDFLEDTVIQFIIDMTHKAMEIGRPGRVQVSSSDALEMLTELLCEGRGHHFPGQEAPANVRQSEGATDHERGAEEGEESI